MNVAHQYKDISSKFLASMHGNAFSLALGIDMKSLERNEPTELPVVEVNNMMMDNLNYLARLVKSLYNRNKKMPKMQVVIIYTADIKEGSTNSILDLGNVILKTQEVFLTSWNTESIIADINRKVESDEPLTEKDIVKFIMTPLSAVGKEAKQDVIRRYIDIIEKLTDGELQLYMYGGLLAFTDKVIDTEDQEEIRRRLSMTKIEKMFYDEKMEAVNNATERTAHDTAEYIATNLLRDGLSPEMISRNTGLDISVVEELSRNLNREQSKEVMPV